MGAEARLKEKNISLPPPPVPVANYISAVRIGTLLFTAGHGPLGPDGKATVHGKLGRDLSVEQGYEAARTTGLNLLAAVRNQLSSLDKVKRV